MRPLLALLLLLVLGHSAAEPSGVGLMYHRFDEDRYPSTSVRSEQFEAQLDYLEENGFTIVPLRQMLAGIFDGAPLPDKAIALTADDAYRSVYTQAYPILKRRGLPMTVFVSTDAIDTKQSGFMSWEQMREMRRHGIDFGNHSASHLHLAHRLEGESETQWLQRLRSDLQRAQQRLDEELGVEQPRLLAYPFGEYNCRVAQLASELGYIALGQHSGAIGPQSRCQALPRFPINERYAELESFALKASSLPMPLQSWQPREPQLTANANPPSLTLRLDKRTKLDPGQISCFLGSGERLEVEEKGRRSLTLRASSPLPAGRSRYNCTAPAGSGRYYWFSQPWFNGPDPADPAY
ncbi:MAG: polysaccharide deacetylase family protein [Pseudomonadota bacterium]